MFKGHKHVSIRSLPGMADRVIRLGSAGKTFSLTAWKVTLQPPTLNSRNHRAADECSLCGSDALPCTQCALTARQLPPPLDACLSVEQSCNARALLCSSACRSGG